LLVFASIHPQLDNPGGAQPKAIDWRNVGGPLQIVKSGFWSEFWVFMQKTSSRRTDSNVSQHKRILAAARRAARKAIKAHKAEGMPIVIWRNGKIVRVPASKISV